MANRKSQQNKVGGDANKVFSVQQQRRILFSSLSSTQSDSDEDIQSKKGFFKQLDKENHFETKSIKAITKKSISKSDKKSNKELQDVKKNGASQAIIKKSINNSSKKPAAIKYKEYVCSNLIVEEAPNDFKICVRAALKELKESASYSNIFNFITGHYAPVLENTVRKTISDMEKEGEILAKEDSKRITYVIYDNETSEEE